MHLCVKFVNMFSNILLNYHVLNMDNSLKERFEANFEYYLKIGYQKTVVIGIR